MIYGTPAGSLTMGRFGTRDRRAIGAAGELMTARVLQQFWPHAAIFHDLHVPGFSINVDHAVLVGDKLLILDSKAWKAGAYWSIGGSYFRGFHTTHAPSQAVAMARESYTNYLRPYGVKVVKPLVVLWTPSQAFGRRAYITPAGNVTGAWVKEEARPFLHYRYPGAKVIRGNDLHGKVYSFVHSDGRPPNYDAVDAMRHQLY